MARRDSSAHAVQLSRPRGLVRRSTRAVGGVSARGLARGAATEPVSAGRNPHGDHHYQAASDRARNLLFSGLEPGRLAGAWPFLDWILLDFTLAGRRVAHRDATLDRILDAHRARLPALHSAAAGDGSPHLATGIATVRSYDVGADR